MQTERYILSLLLWIVATQSVAAKKSAPNPQLKSLLTKVQKAWTQTKSYQTKFQQSVSSKLMPGDPDKSSGSLFVQKPNRLRWESNEGVIQIIDGKSLTLIQPQRKIRIVDIYKDYTKHLDPSFVEILSGRINIERRYHTKLLPPPKGSKSKYLELKPKSGLEERYIAEIDKVSYFLLALTTETAESLTVIRFSDTKRNVKLSAKRFRYQKRKNDRVTKH